MGAVYRAGTDIHIAQDANASAAEVGGQELFTSLVEFDAALRRLAGKSFERSHVDRSLHEAWALCKKMARQNKCASVC